MNKKVVTPLMIFGLVLLVAVVISWFAFPAWQTIPGGFWTLLGVATLGVLVLLKDGAAYVKSVVDILAADKKEDPKATQPPTANTQETHDTIGLIPPVKAVTYVHRGEIEDQVLAFLREGGAGAIVGVHAPGGLGKTELAKHAAETMKTHFDGLLWVDVGEKEPQQVLGDMLIHCGVQVEPGAPYERYKTELQHALRSRRLLVILDDVRGPALAALTDLLPPKPCAALVTSRIQQIGGVNQTFELNRMTPKQARELQVAVLGDDVVDAENEIAAKLAERCAFNPLALEIACRRIRQLQGSKPIARYFERAQGRFAELRMDGDARWDMQRIFDLSFYDLNETDQQRLQTLAAFDRSGFSIEAAATVWQADLAESSASLSRFINLSLVKNVAMEDEGLERYRLHDLLDEYTELRLKESGEQHEVCQRMATWILALFSENYVPDLENKNTLLAERDNLLRACTWARGQKDTKLLARLATQSQNWFRIYFPDSWHLWTAWLEACLQLGVGDHWLEANVRKAIGDVQQFRKEMDAALESYNEALKLFKAVGDRLGEANVLQAIGNVQHFRNKHDAALESYNEALKLFKTVRNRLGEANVRKAIGDVQQFRDEHDAALESYNEALQRYKAIGDRLGEANVLRGIGNIQLFRKEIDVAIETYNAAFKLVKAVGDRLGEANVLRAIGDIQQFRQEMDAALKSYNQALQHYKAVGSKLGEADILFEIGNVYQFRDERDAAIESYNEALQRYKAIGGRLGEANVLRAIGDVQQFRHEMDAAIENYNEALQRYKVIGSKLGEANVYISLGQLKQQAGNHAEARQDFQDALEQYQKISDGYGQARALHRIGDCEKELGDKTRALACYQQASELWQKIGLNHLVEEIIQPKIDALNEEE